MITKNLGTTATAAVLDKEEILNDAANIAVQTILTGDPTAVTIDYEGSLDGETWGLVESHAFDAGELTALSQFFFVVNKPLPFIRINVSTATFTTAGTVSSIIRYDEI